MKLEAIAKSVGLNSSLTMGYLLGLIKAKYVSAPQKHYYAIAGERWQKGLIVKDEKLIIKNPEFGFTVQSLQNLKNQLKTIGKKTCLDCAFCQLKEETVEELEKLGFFDTLLGGSSSAERRVYLVCRKFLLDLNDKLESAKEYSSFLTEKEYHEKAIKGEIIGFAGVTKNEGIPIQKPVMAKCDYCQAQ